MANDWLIVDGYNVINAWKELSVLAEESLDHAREKLLERLSSYGAFRSMRTVVVFDAHERAGEAALEENAAVTVIFTAAGETADSYIERLAYEVVRRGETVYVVTNDWAEQMTVLGAGAYRKSARELIEDCRRARQEMEKEKRAKADIGRSEVGSRLEKDVLDKLEQWRRQSR